MIFPVIKLGLVCKAYDSELATYDQVLDAPQKRG